MTEIDPTILQQRWIHSHEEDTDTTRVYRPASYAFPPARGRAVIELHADDSYTEDAPGPTDTPERAGSGRWSLDGDVLKLESADGSTRAIKIASAGEDELVIEK
jgi:hypothetical protein